MALFYNGAFSIKKYCIISDDAFDWLYSYSLFGRQKQKDPKLAKTWKDAQDLRVLLKTLANLHIGLAW